MQLVRLVGTRQQNNSYNTAYVWWCYSEVCTGVNKIENKYRWILSTYTHLVNRGGIA